MDEVKYVGILVFSMLGLELTLPLILAVVLAINVVPAFMPPTWTILAYFYVTQGGNPLELALVGAVAATIGRIILALWSGPLVSGFLNKSMKRNVEYMHNEFSRKPKAEFFFTFLYALSPFPSNAVFILAGTAKLRLVPILSGFFLGRAVSYYTLLLLSSFTVDLVKSSMSFTNVYVQIVDVLGIVLTVGVFLIDWQKFVAWIKKRMKV